MRPNRNRQCWKEGRAAGQAAPVVRLPSNEPTMAMKALDAGSYGLICPLVNFADEARAFVAATCYPPDGWRSFGPSRGLLCGGPDYAAEADGTVVWREMVETREGLQAVEAICAVEGLDGIFVGPNDLGLNLGHSASSDPAEPGVADAIVQCLAAATAAGKRTGIFCPSGAVARRGQFRFRRPRQRRPPSQGCNRHRSARRKS